MADLTQTAIDRALQGPFGRPCRVLREIDSTNTEALRWSTQGAPTGALVVAEHQTAGRGRRGRTWVDAPGSSLLFSLVLRPAMRFDRLGLLSVALGVGVADGVERSTGIPASIKWPNDITVERRKLAGILIETKLAGPNVDVAVGGVGLNVARDLPPELESAATSVAAECEARGIPVPDRVDLLAVILDAIGSVYPLALDEDSNPELLARAAARSDVLGQQVLVRMADGVVIEGRAARLLPDGALELVTETGGRAVSAGEIEQLRHA